MKEKLSLSRIVRALSDISISSHIKSQETLGKAVLRRAGSLVLVLVLCGSTSIYYSSCVNTIDTMVEDYNSNLTKKEEPLTEKPPDPVPGDEDFNQDSMLQEKYLVAKNATFCISAPKSSYYLWQIYRIIRTSIDVQGVNVTETYEEEIVMNGIVPVQNQMLNLYMADLALLMPAGTYKLVLTVKDSTGKEYKDVSALSIYEPLQDYSAK
ncbi:MAG: hypothetical protein MJZ50_04985 [Treponema sp.]|nr:hypothetical protein [Treponema sp.]